MELIQEFVDFSTNFISTGGIFFGFLLVFSEAFFSPLPLSVFVALNVHAFGFLVGVLISWSATVLGGFLCYLICYKLEQKLIRTKFYRKHFLKIDKGVSKFRNITFSQLVLVFTVPFTPSFLVNVISGFSKVPRKKFLASILIGKMFTITFLGYIGMSVFDGFHDIKTIIFIILALVIAYVLSKIVGKRMNIE